MIHWRMKVLYVHAGRGSKIWGTMALIRKVPGEDFEVYREECDKPAEASAASFKAALEFVTPYLRCKEDVKVSSLPWPAWAAKVSGVEEAHWPQKEPGAGTPFTSAVATLLVALRTAGAFRRPQGKVVSDYRQIIAEDLVSVCVKGMRDMQSWSAQRQCPIQYVYRKVM